ncbi:hypothetical protein ACPOL_1980 [Acidisarcina polymorpha]|uniref:Uncharacterized protein n=1 Tax=Acidisarcina polymorpha TaxID=2211140 RepID=A0A2Z5FY63_9BACT|nr:hypothetical protein ACPOL_1980 [Acidisarcina polymorpha]
MPPQRVQVDEQSDESAGDHTPGTSLGKRWPRILIEDVAD